MYFYLNSYLAVIFITTRNFTIHRCITNFSALSDYCIIKFKSTFSISVLRGTFNIFHIEVIIRLQYYFIPITSRSSIRRVNVTNYGLFFSYSCRQRKVYRYTFSDVFLTLWAVVMNVKTNRVSLAVFYVNFVSVIYASITTCKFCAYKVSFITNFTIGNGVKSDFLTKFTSINISNGIYWTTFFGASIITICSY